MIKSDLIAALAELKDDEQVRVAVGDDQYLVASVEIEPFGTTTFPSGERRHNNHAVIRIEFGDMTRTDTHEVSLRGDVEFRVIREKP